MIDVIKQKAKTLGSVENRYNFCREFLQELILQVIDRQGFTTHLAFVGGTALRIIHDLARFSEDLDFTLANPDKFSFLAMTTAITRQLELHGFKVECPIDQAKTVLSSAIKFKGLLYELGLSKHKAEKISIKLELDQLPPFGYQTELRLVNKNLMFKTQVYDLPSLFSGKLHAFLCRPYAKGRDYYDLLWFLSRQTPINFPLLNQAIAQTHANKLPIDAEALQQQILSRIKDTPFAKIRQDLRPFLSKPEEMNLFESDLFTQSIATYFSREAVSTFKGIPNDHSVLLRGSFKKNPGRPG